MEVAETQLSSTERASNSLLTIALSPSGNLYIDENPPASTEMELPSSIVDSIKQEFEKGSGFGLLHLAVTNIAAATNETLQFWRNFSGRFIMKLRELADPDDATARGLTDIVLSEQEATEFIQNAPLMKGLEYLTLETLQRTWDALRSALLSELGNSALTIESYLRSKNELWSIVGRVFFHLAENKLNTSEPFAFLATYTTGIPVQGKVQHAPLRKATENFSKNGRKSSLLSLLLPVHKASSQSRFLKGLVDSGKLFHPQPWSPDTAYCFLKDIPIFEEVGIGVKVPNWWKSSNPPRPKLEITVGEDRQEGVGADALLDFSATLALGEHALSEEEIEELLQSGEGLVRFKGNWVEVNKERLQELLSKWKQLRKEVGKDGVQFLDGLRMIAGLPLNSTSISKLEFSTGQPFDQWLTIKSGAWFSSVLEGLRHPDRKSLDDLAISFKAVLRPYQEVGVQWL